MFNFSLKQPLCGPPETPLWSPGVYDRKVCLLTHLQDDEWRVNAESGEMKFVVGENVRILRNTCPRRWRLHHKYYNRHGLGHGCARVAHCVIARWRNFSHYCRPLHQYDVRFTCTEHREALTTSGQHAAYTNKHLQCKDEVHSSPLNK